MSEATEKDKHALTPEAAALVRAMRAAQFKLRRADDWPMDAYVQFDVCDIFAFAEALAAEGVTVTGKHA